MLFTPVVLYFLRMDSKETLRARISDAVQKLPFYHEAETLSDALLVPGTTNFAFVGKCVPWADEALRGLRAEGLDVLPVCTASHRCGVNHVFLMVRDPESKQVLYYDPSGEQHGVAGAHRQAFTRSEITAFNQQHGTKWLDKPILYTEGAMHPEFKDRWEEFEALRATWGSELHYDVPQSDRIVSGKRFMSV